MDKLIKEFNESKEEKRKFLFSKISKSLHEHMNLEEKVLFPLFKKRSDSNINNPSSVLVVAHKDIRKTLKEIEQLLEKMNKQLT